MTIDTNYSGNVNVSSLELQKTFLSFTVAVDVSCNSRLMSLVWYVLNSQMFENRSKSLIFTKIKTNLYFYFAHFGREK